MATVVPLPNLDDRRWVDLVEEARALIPFHAPTWTDHNAHDPGVTVLELLAWVAEMDVYAIDRITDAHRLKFLALAGIRPLPPRASHSMLGLRLADGSPPCRLPAGAQFAGHDAFGGSVPFRTRHDLTVQPGRLVAVLSGDGIAAPRDLTAPWLRGEPIQPFGPDPGPGASLYLGFAVPEAWSDGTSLSIGFSLADGDRSGPGERTRLAAERAAAASDCRPPWEIVACGCPTGCACDDPQPGTSDDAVRPRHHGATLAWELLTGPRRWTRLPAGDVDDDTRAFTLDGRVILRLPAGAAESALAPHPAVLRWVRVRLAHGAFDAAPTLRGLVANAVEVEQAVPGVVTLRLAQDARIGDHVPEPGARTGVDLRLDGVGDVTEVEFPAPEGERPVVRLLELDPAKGRLVIEASAVLAAAGRPAEVVLVPDAPFLAGSLEAFSTEGGAWRRWSARADFDASRPPDAHVVADPSRGAIVFGDGDAGRAAPAGSTVLVSADVTRAADGNLPAGSIRGLADSPRNRAVLPDLEATAAALAEVSHVVPAEGGVAAENVPAALARARQGREETGRAVTLEDYARLARRTPGVRLARAEARANLHPGFGCQSAPGVVTVLVLPYLPAGRPTPGPGLRRAVAAYLNRRRVIGTRVEVAGPVYVPVTVRASVEAVRGTQPPGLAAAVRAALDAFMHPLTGGPDRTGWPFGRDVYRSEVLAVIDEVPGVAHVQRLELVGADGRVSCGNLCLGPLGLVDAGAHEIEVR